MRMGNVIFWVIMAGVLVAMLVLAFQDAAQTGEDPNIVGAIAAWVAITAVSCFFWWLYGLVGRGVGKLADEASKYLDEEEEKK